jgi:hypothetical protein
MELLKEIAPRVTRVAILYNPTTAPYAEIYIKPFKAAAASLGVEANTAPVRDTSELEIIVGAHARAPNGRLIAMPDAFMNTHRERVVSLAAHHHLPAVYAYRLNAKIGGLLSYAQWCCWLGRRRLIFGSEEIAANSCLIAMPLDGQPRRTMLAEDPGSTRLERHFPSGAAQTRIVSVARIRLDSRKSVRPFKGIICGDISEFESCQPSHAVSSPAPNT